MDLIEQKKKLETKNFLFKIFLRPVASIPVTRGGVVSQKIYNRLYFQAVS